jgi:hypothetical protein
MTKHTDHAPIRMSSYRQGAPLHQPFADEVDPFVLAYVLHNIAERPHAKPGRSSPDGRLGIDFSDRRCVELALAVQVIAHYRKVEFLASEFFEY